MVNSRNLRNLKNAVPLDDFNTGDGGRWRNLLGFMFNCDGGRTPIFWLLPAKSEYPKTIRLSHCKWQKVEWQNGAMSWLYRHHSTAGGCLKVRHRTPNQSEEMRRTHTVWKEEKKSMPILSELLSISDHYMVIITGTINGIYGVRNHHYEPWYPTWMVHIH